MQPAFVYVLCLSNLSFLLVLYQGTTESEHINLKVLGQDNAVVQFKIKKHTPLRKLMNAYCDRAVSLSICRLMIRPLCLS